MRGLVTGTVMVLPFWAAVWWALDTLTSCR
jgi:hypothetical protein